MLWFHTWFGTRLFTRLESIPVLRMGWFGVDVFFALSGFLITTLLLREQKRYGTIRLRDFYIRRGLRIWPLYYAVLGLYVALVLLTERHTARGNAFFHYLPGYLTYTYTWFGLKAGEPSPIFNFAWTLAVEEQFYVFWPLALQFVRRPWPVILMLMLIGARLLSWYSVLNHVVPPETLAARMIAGIAVPICLGALLAHALQNERVFAVVRRWLGWKGSAPAALVILLLCLIPDGASWRPLAWAAVIALLATCVVREDNGLAGILGWRPLAGIGVVSYGMYLLNTLTIQAVRHSAAHLGLLNPAAVFPFSVAATALIAWLSYRWFESPFLALKTRFSRLPPKTDTQTPVVAGEPMPAPASMEPVASANLT